MFWIFIFCLSRKRMHGAVLRCRLVTAPPDSGRHLVMSGTNMAMQCAMVLSLGGTKSSCFIFPMWWVYQDTTQGVFVFKRTIFGLKEREGFIPRKERKLHLCVII